MIREDFLQQNAFQDEDTYTSLDKQLKMLKVICEFDNHAREALASYASLNEILSIPSIEKIGRMKYTPEEKMSEIDDICSEMCDELAAVARGGEEDE